MKKIEAYIQPFMTQKVVDALRDVGVFGLTVWEVKGFGKHIDESFPHHSSEEVVALTNKTKIEILVHDTDVEKITSVIFSKAHTGRKGDGKIIVFDAVERIISISSGVEGETAI